MPHLLPAGEERRDLNLADADVQVLQQNQAQRFTGHAAVFNKRAAIGNPKTYGFWEQVAPGAFSRTINGGDARMLIDHDSKLIVSRVSAGTLNLSQSAHGLAVDSALDHEVSYVRDLTQNLRNGNISGMSFGFQVLDDAWAKEEQRDADGSSYEVEVRTIREVKLFEVSAVTFPAYAETDAGLRHSLVPALRSRGDRDAIQRAVSAKPWLGPLLDYDPELAPAHISLHIDGERINEAVVRAMKKPKAHTFMDGTCQQCGY